MSDVQTLSDDVHTGVNRQSAEARSPISARFSGVHKCAPEAGALQSEKRQRV